MSGRTDELCTVFDLGSCGPAHLLWAVCLAPDEVPMATGHRKGAASGQDPWTGQEAAFHTAGYVDGDAPSRAAVANGRNARP